MDVNLRLRNWAGLSELVLDLICKKLPSFSDCLRFSVVCKPWFSFVFNNCDALKQRVKSGSLEELPILMICTDPDHIATTITSLYSATKGKIIENLTIPLGLQLWKFCGSSHGWLAFQYIECLSIILYNPFSTKTIPLPNLHFTVRKIIISKNPSTNPNDFEVVATINVWNRLHELAILKPDAGTWIFTRYNNIFAGAICDMIYYNETYYAVTYGGRVLCIDGTSLNLKEIFEPPSIMNSFPFTKFYLVKTSTYELLRVQISFPRDNPSSRVKISKLVASKTTQKSMFSELDNLGDEALFLCDYGSVSISTSKFSRFIPNSVYYVDNDLRLELPGNQFIFDIIHLQYGSFRTHFSFK
ncbi:PREDICTED: probable F-box protein At1g44080 [Nicotiana attenuata]|uniref:probable F-box protein At1g44080 n=1 Tax=Nicotiana attenuata TaxID=49451 RepID=UPI0009050865|nr:PREDICTED: probable F-box protein At1g44080 [Nicotiana attenuata]